MNESVEQLYCESVIINDFFIYKTAKDVYTHTIFVSFDIRGNLWYYGTDFQNYFTVRTVGSFFIHV